MMNGEHFEEEELPEHSLSWTIPMGHQRRFFFLSYAESYEASSSKRAKFTKK
jgi:hypothetical protein